MTVLTHDILADCQAFPRTTAKRHGGVNRWIGRTLAVWAARIRERRAFGSLDHRDLRDLGLSRWEVERELAKPFWRG
jgi:uncharacterized protein YjiS (DUF1127 family)